MLQACLAKIPDWARGFLTLRHGASRMRLIGLVDSISMRVRVAWRGLPATTRFEISPGQHGPVALPCVPVPAR